MISLESKLESVLFYKGEAETTQNLAKLLEVSVEEIEQASHTLSASLAQRGVRLLRVNDELELVTAPETSDVVQAMRKEELVRDLGRAGSETLAIVAYRGPVTRAQIDYIRGVNSSFILRNLMIRGLVERVQNPNNARSVLYRPTPALLEEMGVARIEDLPDFATVQEDIASFEARKDTQTTGNDSVTPPTELSDHA